MGFNEGPRISLPEDPKMVQQLEDKLQEYHYRLDLLEQDYPNHTPEQIVHTDVGYKVMILESVLEKGSIDAWDLCENFRKGTSYFDIVKFTNAVSVIDDYCKTGGQNTYGGTGLLRS